MKIHNAACILFLIVGLISADAYSQTTGALRIGMLVPLTGDYASGGVDNRQGVEAALALSKSKPSLQLFYADSKADPVTGINEFRKLADSDHVLAVFVMRGSVGMALNPISSSTETPIFGGVGNKDFAAANKFAFQAWSKSDDEGEFLAQTLRKRNYRTLAMLTVQDDWQSAVSKELRNDFPDQVGSIVYDQEVIPSESDFRAILLKIKQTSADVLFANLSLAQLGPFLRQAKELDVAKKIYSNFWVAKKDVLESAGLSVVEGVRFVEMNTEMPTLKQFVAKEYSATPSGATLSAYATTLLLQQVAAEDPRISTTAELYSELLKQTDIRTPDGPIVIKDRCVKFPLIEKTIHDGKVVVESSLDMRPESK